MLHFLRPRKVQIPWSQERAHDLEELLTAIVKQLPAATNLHGASYMHVGHDSKVYFGLSDQNPNWGFFLEFRPHMNQLRAWPSGVVYAYPEALKTIINRLFPQSHYSFVESDYIDGFHYWDDITEEELRLVVAAL